MPILRALDPDGPGSINLEHFIQLAAACSTPQIADVHGPSGRGGSAGPHEYGEDYEESGDASRGAPQADDDTPKLEEDGDPKVLEFIR